MKFYLLLSFTLISWIPTDIPKNVNRVKAVHVSPKENTGQDFSLLRYNLDTLIQNTWSDNHKSIDSLENVIPNIISANSIVGSKIPIDPKRWYQLNHVENGLNDLFDGNIETEVFTGWSKVLLNYDSYYPLEVGEKINIQSVKFYDGYGTMVNTPFKLYGITDKWERVLIATFTGEVFNNWVGPNPSDKYNFVISKPPTANFRYLLINCYGTYPREVELYGTYTPSTISHTDPPLKKTILKNAFGVNGFEWDFLKKDDTSEIDEAEMNALQSFTGFRQYMDWEKIEHFENVYTYNPCYNGGWNYDVIYERCKQAGIEVLPCLQGVPDWFYETYPEISEHDSQIIPVRFGKPFADPQSYRDQAEAGFQYVARYGNNPNVDKSLLSVYDKPRWTHDSPNVLKVGLGLIKYIECGNERDKWWKGRKGYQTAREYAANLSAFYDGHKNTMGAGIGVKNADPNIKVVMAGLASADPGYVRGMIDWCKEFRGYKADGKVDLCWDVINYHLYADDANSSQSGTSTRSKAPEISAAYTIAKEFVQMAHDYAYDMPVWITEFGSDLNQESPLKAIPIGKKNAEITQADWGLRSALMYNRLGIERSFFYMLYDTDLFSTIQFASSGLIDSLSNRRPVADYLYQTKNLIGEYFYQETLSQNPLVDRYELNGKSIYVMMVPDEIGRTTTYALDLKSIHDIKIYTPKAGSYKMDSLSVKDNTGKFQVSVSETPIFIIPGEKTSADDNGPIPLGEQPNEKQAISIVYPNPTSDVLHLIINDLSRINSIKLTNIKGVTVIEPKVISANEINVKAIQSGNYFLIVQLKDGRTESHKVMISR